MINEEDGVDSGLLPSTNVVVDVLGHKAIGPVPELSRIPLFSLAAVMLASGPIADAFAATAGAQNAGFVGFQTKAIMDANLAFGAHTLAIVSNDPTPANNGLYEKQGISGAGSWTKSGDIALLTPAEADAFRELLTMISVSDDPSGFTHVWADMFGAAMGALTAAGVFVGNGFRLSDKFSIETVENSEFMISFQAENGVVVGIRPDGTIAARGLAEAGDSLAAPAINRNISLLYDVMQILFYGQSLSRGQGGKPVLTTAQKYNAVRFSGGVRADDGGTNPAVIYADYVPAVAGINPVNTALGETPAHGFSDMVMQLLASENDVSHVGLGSQFLLCAPGEGGKKISELQKGTAYYTRLMENVQYGAIRSAAKLRSHTVGCLPFIEGQGDTNSLTDPSVYQAASVELLNDFQSDAEAFLPDLGTIRMPITQANCYKFYGKPTPAIAVAQYGLPDIDPRISLVVPDYIFETSGVHSNARGYKWMGAYFGLWYKRVVLEGGYWRDMRVKSFTVQGRVLTVQFNVDVAPLVFDTTLVSDPGNFGFNLVNPALAPVAFSVAPAIAGPDTVRFVAPADIAVNSRLRHCWNGTAVDGPTTGPRGCLRDSRGDKIRFDPEGLNLPLHAHPPAFDLLLAP